MSADNENRKPMISVVIPVYRSATILPKTLERLDAFFAQHEYPHEIIFVNDGSPDDSWRVLRELKANRDDVIAIDLMRNYGQHSAMMCGLQESRGDYVITMDDDLQNPPEEIEHLVNKAEEGDDVVFGRFHQKMHGFVRRIGSRIVNWLNVKLFKKPATLTLTNFRIIRREAVDAACEFRTTYPYLPGILLMTGKTFANVDVEHHARAQGKSNYTGVVIARLIWRIIFNYSAFPLRLLCGIGLVTALASFLVGVYFVFRKLSGDTQVPGWTSLIVLLSFYQGLTLVVLAALGEYVVRLVNDVSGPRAYRVRQKI
ncbi:MAG: glycosyltransferase [Planctomycetaceae bacterium]|nr:glycosyltransferase [Planctomycetaceae bacterium]